MMEFQIKAMDMWFRTLPGALIADMELRQLDRFLPTIPGEIALQVGGPSNLRLLQKSMVQHTYYCSDQPTHSGDGTRLQCQFHELPFESDSISLIVLSHALEFVEDPELVLNELYRILKPGGQLFIFGFNYWGLWSLVRKFKHSKGYPWSGTFYSIWQMKAWLGKIGYGVVSNKSFCFIGPHKKRPTNRWMRLTEVLGQVFIPKMGAVHLIYAQKKVAGMTPLAKLWARKVAKPKSRVVSPIIRVKL